MQYQNDTRPTGQLLATTAGATTTRARLGWPASIVRRALERPMAHHVP